MSLTAPRRRGEGKSQTRACEVVSTWRNGWDRVSGLRNVLDLIISAGSGGERVMLVVWYLTLG